MRGVWEGFARGGICSFFGFASGSGLILQRRLALLSCSGLCERVGRVVEMGRWVFGWPFLVFAALY
jgi:hypothetical protein